MAPEAKTMALALGDSLQGSSFGVHTLRRLCNLSADEQQRRIKKPVEFVLVQVESIRPATNFPGISVDTNRFNCLVEKSGLGVEPRRLLSPVKQV